jgi:4-diphosphocytidyl-2-C-methyl-D-erythritol kinase
VSGASRREAGATVPAGAARAEPAPAKVNLALHVTARRSDGYHVLDSLVAFAAPQDAGDVVTVHPGSPGPGGVRLTVSGPFADAVPDGADNIAVAAARATGGIAAVHLHKGLPVAAGIGGGSADAAAVLRAAAAAGIVERAALPAIALSLGADVPVCLDGRPCRMRGIGEALSPVRVPAVPALLVNPGVPVATGAVFARLASRANPPLPDPPAMDTPQALVTWLAATRNDLEAQATAIAPAIGEAVAALSAQRGCRLARMSGSGATVFGLFDDAAARDAAAEALGTAHGQGWWIAPATLGGPDGLVTAGAAAG